MLDLEVYIVPDLEQIKNIRVIISQYGGGYLSYKPFAPGGLAFGRPGGMGASGINRYYEVPLDSNLKRIHDPSYSDDTINIEKRLEVFHDDIENDLKGYVLKDDDFEDLKKSDLKLRYEKILSTPAKKPTKEEKFLEVCFEVLLQAARTNDNTKHPFEDANPPTIKPTRRHTVSQIYINRGLGISPFLGTDFEGEKRSPYDKARMSTPPDGNPRFFGHDTGVEVAEFLETSPDVDFQGLYGESLAFNFPPDKETPAKYGDQIPQLIEKLMQKANQLGSEAGMELKRKIQTLLRLPAGIGKDFRVDQNFGDTRDQFQEVQGVADAFPATPTSAAGLGYLGISKS